MAAGDAVVKGTNDFTEQPSRLEWIRGRGWRKIRIFEGPLDNTKINTLTATLQATNCEGISVMKGWPTVVEATVPSDSNTVGVGLADPDSQIEWSLEPYDLEKTLGTHGKFNLSESAAATLVLIDKEIKSGEAYNKDYDTLYPSTGAFNKYVKLRGQGTDSYLSYGFNLKKTVTCESANVYVREFQEQENNVGKIISWDAIGVPAASLIKRPRLYFYDGLGKFGSVDWVYANINEWMVRPIAVRYVKEGRVRKRQLSQSFLGAVQWSETLYDGGTGKP